jgi:hypothetical protein
MLTDLHSITNRRYPKYKMSGDRCYILILNLYFNSSNFNNTVYKQLLYDITVYMFTICWPVGRYAGYDILVL